MNKNSYFFMILITLVVTSAVFGFLITAIVKKNTAPPTRGEEITYPIQTFPHATVVVHRRDNDIWACIFYNSPYATQTVEKPVVVPYMAAQVATGTDSWMRGIVFP